MSDPSMWKQVAADKQQSRLNQVPESWRLSPAHLALASIGTGADLRAIPESCGLLSGREIEITGSPVQVIVLQIHQRVWSSEEVTVAFCKRAAIAHQLTNCLTELFHDEAISAAQAFDREYERTGKLPSPLAGLPISLKDNFNIIGKDSNLGFVAWINDPMQVDSTLVTLLRQQGAIPFCKTATPTAMMIAETVSNANGRTLSPFNTNLTPGGSSGGESALIAMKGSPLGVGTDIGGSIRIPCSFTGLWGLKPSFGRFPTHACRSGMAGQEAVMSINGPMCVNSHGLEIFAQAVVDTEPWKVDPKCVPIPWKPVSEITVPNHLTIILVVNNGLVTPTPPIQRGMKQAAKSYRAAGHTVIEWDASQSEADTELFARGLAFIEGFFGAEGGETIQGIMSESGEDSVWVPGLATPNLLAKRSVVDLWKLQGRRTAWAGEMMAKFKEVGGTNDVDAIVSPVAAEVATRHDAYHHIAYTSVWNLLDMPSVVYPLHNVTVDKDTDSKDSVKFQPRNKIEAKVWEQYDASDFHGMAVCLQVVGHRLQEERTLAAARQLHKSGMS